VDVATERGIPVTNVPSYCADEVAEHVIALIFALVRGLHRYDRTVRDGDWSLARGLPTQRISGSTLGIIGHGEIGRAVHQRAVALGLRVLVHTRSGGTPLPELLAGADYVSLHVPATPETAGLVDGAFLAAMKPSAYLINCARGAVVDDDAILRALRDGTIAGAGLDVFLPEPLPAGHPLLALDNVIVTPHTAFYSEQSVAEARCAAANVAEVLSGGRPGIGGQSGRLRGRRSRGPDLIRYDPFRYVIGC
jgi:D-3-phosphoglycerate dehydrogenase